MSYKPRSLFRLIQEINFSLFLPHIQRPFVWDVDQMRRLFDSLMRNYPIQTLLFWRTKDAIKTRRFMPTVEWDAELHEYYETAKSAGGVEKVLVLDGQQRLQSLFAIFNGAICGANGNELLEAYFDVTKGHAAGDDGLQYPLEFAAKPASVRHYRLRDLLGKHDQKNAEEISEEVNTHLDAALSETPEAAKSREKQVRRNIAQLVSLLREEKYFWIEELDGVASQYPYEKILDIFVRVNSGGTKLDSGDLMFAAMKADWNEVEEKVEQMVELLNAGRLSFDKDFVLKCLVVTHGQGAELRPERFTTAEGDKLLKAIETDWAKAEEAFQQLRDFIATDLKLYSDKVIRSYGSFNPLFDYLYHNPKPDPVNRSLMKGYYYKSQLFSWYAVRTDQVIDAVHRVVGKACPNGFPLSEVKDYFTRSFGVPVVLTAEHLSDMRLRFIILNLVYAEQFADSPFNVAYKGNEPHIDHIYPQSMLRSQLKLNTAEINHIGNYRYLGASDNIRKRAELPASYFTRMKEGKVDIRKHLLLPDVSDDPSLLEFDAATYSDFRDRRTQAIFQISNRVVNPELA
jgi:hypothetical protein